MKREVGVLKNLYTCLRVAPPPEALRRAGASAKAGRHLSTFYCSVFRHITKITPGDIVCDP